MSSLHRAGGRAGVRAGCSLHVYFKQTNSSCYSFREVLIIFACVSFNATLKHFRSHCFDLGSIDVCFIYLILFTLLLFTCLRVYLRGLVSVFFFFNTSFICVINLFSFDYLFICWSQRHCFALRTWFCLFTDLICLLRFVYLFTCLFWRFHFDLWHFFCICLLISFVYFALLICLLVYLFISELLFFFIFVVHLSGLFIFCLSVYLFISEALFWFVTYLIHSFI